MNCVSQSLEAALANVLWDTYDFLGRFVVFPSEHDRVAVTLWVAHTHAVDLFYSTPRLSIGSPEPGSGKSRLLEVASALVRSSLYVFGASTAAVFRSIGQDPRPTLLFDEVDAIFGYRGRGDQYEDLRAVLNVGHRRGATIPRCVGPAHDVAQFDVFAPVALAGLGELPETLRSRSISIGMKPRGPGETVEPFRMRDHEPQGHAIRDRLADAVGALSTKLSALRPKMPPGVEDRPADVWEPLLAIAEAAGGEWPELGRGACGAMTSEVVRRRSLGINLLEDCRKVLGTRGSLSTEDLLKGLQALPESPWARLRGRPIDARALASFLGEYSIHSTNVRFPRGQVLKGYRTADFFDAWQRYLRDPADHGDAATAATAATGLDLTLLSSGMSSGGSGGSGFSDGSAGESVDPRSLPPHSLGLSLESSNPGEELES